MIDRRLTRLIGESRKYIILNVLMQWISLCANIVMMYGLSVFLSALFINALEVLNHRQERKLHSDQ